MSGSLFPVSLALVVSLFITVSRSEAQPDFTLSVGDQLGLPGTTVSVPILADTAETSLGWSIGVCYDTAGLNVVGAVSGSTTLTIDSGSPPDFAEIVVSPEGLSIPVGSSHGAHQGVVISFSSGATLPVGNGYELFVVEFEIEGIVGESAVVETCDTAPSSSFAPMTFFAPESGGLVAPEQRSGLVWFGTPVPRFRRGDGNADGVFDISDAVFALAWLFTSGNDPICDDAADANDDGTIDISDAVFTLFSLFIVGTPTPPPPGSVTCGVDPTSDALDCQEWACP
ncbi:MAG: hypothetical protein KDC38_00275 [Planctomycetes bacterium]|nr:hypothetical protein [Planctomycetota bacterium]